jgi:hypothetical protein
MTIGLISGKDTESGHSMAPLDAPGGKKTGWPKGVFVQLLEKL